MYVTCMCAGGCLQECLLGVPVKGVYVSVPAWGCLLRVVSIRVRLLGGVC